MSSIGHYALFLAIAISLVQTIFGLLRFFTWKKKYTQFNYFLGPLEASWIHLYFPLCFFLIHLAISDLAYSFLCSDFSIINVLENSHSAQPLMYKISALWGNHEGSMLLWCWILNLYFFLFFHSIPEEWKETLFWKKMATHATYINLFFLFFTFYTSNPFLRSFHINLDGFELNPILQDPGLIIHPPLLYCGYIGFSIIFVMLLSGSNEQAIPTYFTHYAQYWTLIPWVFLTLGITLGSWWAYHELGWGGWWFWDPVENASLMPWLTGVALIHSLSSLDKKKRISYWSYFLGISSFLLSLLGTFFVRSGLLSSVHSFANDSARGVFILAFIVVILILSLSSFLYRNSEIFFSVEDDPFTRKHGIIVQNILLSVMTFTIILGTFSPVIFSSFFARDISIGPPFYNHLIIPMMIPFILFMTITPFLSYKQFRLIPSFVFLKQKDIWIGFIASSLILILWGIQDAPLTNALFIVTSLLMVATLFIHLRDSRRNISMIISHLGFGIAVLVISVSGYLFQESIQIMKPGNQVKLGDHRFIFKGADYLKGPNYHSSYGSFVVLDEKSKKPVATLTPEKRFYFIQGIFATKASIHTNPISDIYAIIGDGNLENGWYTRFYHYPGVSYLWIGGVLIASGAALSAYKISSQKE